MDLIIILQAGVASGTVLLFATIGEIFAERSGVMNLGVEGMMLIGAMSAFSVTASTGNPWLGLFVAMLAGGLLGEAGLAGVLRELPGAAQSLSRIQTFGQRLFLMKGS